MLEIIGLATIKLLGHGRLWRRGEVVTFNDAYANGGSLLIIGLVTSLFTAVLFFTAVYAHG